MTLRSMRDYYVYIMSNYSGTLEKEIKAWRRSKKLALIRSMNPDWKDLSAEWNRPEPERFALRDTHSF